MKLTLKQALPALVVLAGGVVLIVALKVREPAPAVSTAANSPSESVSVSVAVSSPSPANDDRPVDASESEGPAREELADPGTSSRAVASPGSKPPGTAVEREEPAPSPPTGGDAVPSTKRADSGRPLTVYVEPSQNAGGSAPAGETSTGIPNEPTANDRSRSAASPDEPQPSGTPEVWMTPTAAGYAVGERVSIVVRVSAPVAIAHVPFHVEFDPAVLRFETGEEGSFLGRDGAQTAFFASGASDGGTVVVGLSRLGRIGGIVGHGDLCVLHFTAVGPGDTGLAFARATVRDPSNRATAGLFRPLPPLVVR